MFLSVSIVLNVFFYVQIDKNESLPWLLCGQCADKLIASYRFRRQCEKSNEILKRNLLNTQSDVSAANLFLFAFVLTKHFRN